MSTTAMNISVTGLNAANKMVTAISQNIANASTPGYRRVDVVTSEMNFSGPGNVPYLPAGVQATAVTPNQPWLDGRLNMAIGQNTQATSYANAMQEVGTAMDTSRIEQSFSDLMATSQQAMVNPNDSVALELFQASLNGFVIDVNQFTNIVTSAIERLQLQREYARTELSATEDQTRRVELQGEIDGIDAAMNTLQPSIEAIDQIIDQSVSDINATYGIDIIDRTSDGHQEQFVASGDFVALTEYGSQQFNSDLGAIKTKVGAQMKNAEDQKQFAQSELQGAADAWNQTYGVDLTQEIVKLKQVEVYQQANLLTLKVSSDMIGSIINAIS